MTNRCEELAFRGYVMNLFADALGTSRWRWIVSLVVTSALFGWGHGNQGITGIAQETLSGLLLARYISAAGATSRCPSSRTACRTRWRSCSSTSIATQVCNARYVNTRLLLESRALRVGTVRPKSAPATPSCPPPSLEHHGSRHCLGPTEPLVNTSCRLEREVVDHQPAQARRHTRDRRDDRRCRSPEHLGRTLVQP